MLKDLFQNRLFIGALAFFIFCVGGSLLYMWHVEQQGAEYDAETQDRVKQWNEKQTKQPTAKAPVVETSKGEDFHVSQPPEPPIDAPPVVQSKPDVSAPVGSAYRPFKDPYQRMVNGFTVTSNYALMLAPPGVGPDWASMSAEELADAIAAINSRNPSEHLRPPKGYKYSFGGTIALSNGGGLWLDDNGYPILTKEDTPAYEINWTEGFRPPPDVYADYKALHKRYMEIHLKTGSSSSPEMDRIRAEERALEAMYRGRIPAGIFGGPPIPPKPPGMDMLEHIRQSSQLERQQFREIKNQLLRTAYESEGIDYLMDRYSNIKKYANLHRYPELKEYAK